MRSKDHVLSIKNPIALMKPVSAGCFIKIFKAHKQETPKQGRIVSPKQVLAHANQNFT